VKPERPVTDEARPDTSETAQADLPRERGWPPIGAVPGAGRVAGGRAQKRAFGLLRVLLVAGAAGG
jgi:hypothetical protein